MTENNFLRKQSFRTRITRIFADCFFYLRKSVFQLILLIITTVWSFTSATAQEIETVRLNINKDYSSEIAPLVHDSLLYFVSNRKSNVLISIFNQNNEHLYKVYSAPLLKGGRLGKARLFQPDKSVNLSEGSLTFSDNGMLQIATFNKIKSYKEARSANRNSEIPLGLFEAQRTSPDTWGEFTQLSFSANSAATFAHPALSPDGTTLVFASNMEGSVGETDLYTSSRTASGWSEPVNMGANINSTGRELFPFFHASGKLYFASDRYGGMGGFDIYVSAFADGEWTNPVPLPSPVNSPFDDFGCYIFPDETSGFFASSREGNDNIYRFDYKIVFCEDAAEVEEENYCFTFFEERAIEADTIPVKYRWRFSDGTETIGASVDHCLPGPGAYEVTLSVIDSVTNEELYDVANYELELERPQQVYFSFPETVKRGDEITLKATLMGFDDAENVHYFWDVNNNDLMLGETITYKFSRRGSYTIRCEAYWGDGQKICSYREVRIE